MNMEQIKNLKIETAKEAVNQSFTLMMGLPLMALRDEFGFGTERLKRFSDKLLDVYDSFDKGFFTLEDVKKTIYEETGVIVERNNSES